MPSAEEEEEEDAEQDEAMEAHGSDHDLEAEDSEESEIEVLNVQKHQGSTLDSDDEEVDRDMLILQQACLPVTGTPMEPTGEFPKDADEYLRQVQWERMHCPEVVDVDVDDRPKARKRRGRNVDQHGSLLQSLEEPLELPEAARQSPEWAEDVERAFRLLRARCAEARKRLAPKPPGLGQQDGSDEHPRHHTCEAWRQRCAASAPSMDLLAMQDFTSISNLVAVAVDRLVSKLEASGTGPVASSACASPETAPEGAAQPTPAQPPASELSPEVLDWSSRWIFAALAFAEEPFFDDMHFQLQRLRRASLRLCRLAVTASPDKVDQHTLARSGLLLVIVTKVFGQR